MRRGKKEKECVVEIWDNLSNYGLGKLQNYGKYPLRCKGSFCTLNICSRMDRTVLRGCKGKYLDSHYFRHMSVTGVRQSS